jgi:hypothetical protein
VDPYWLLVWRRVIKGDGWRRMKYEGEDLHDKDGIFRFEGSFEVPLVWMVLSAGPLAGTQHPLGACL